MNEMRCPQCGYVSFDYLTACRRCGQIFPQSRRPLVAPPTPASVGLPLPPLPVVEVQRPIIEGQSAAGMEEEDFVYAGFGRRLIAVLVDSLILFVLAVLAMVLAILAAIGGGTAAGEVTRQVKLLALGASLLAGFAVGLAYHLLCWGQGGQTPGKMLMGIRVVGGEGEEIGYGRAFLRLVGYLFALLPLGGGFLMIAFHSRRRGLHDLLAGTYVIQVSRVSGKGGGG